MVVSVFVSTTHSDREPAFEIITIDVFVGADIVADIVYNIRCLFLYMFRRETT